MEESCCHCNAAVCLQHTYSKERLSFHEYTCTCMGSKSMTESNLPQHKTKHSDICLQSNIVL